MSEDIIRYVNAACEGDTSAIGMLYTKTLRTSFYLANKLSDDKDSATEIVKKSYARAFCTINKLKKPEAFEIWMKQNIASVYKESQSFTYDEADGGLSETSMEFLPETVLEDKEQSEKILNIVSELSPEVRTAIVLHYYCGMPVSSLSKFLGVSESTINALISSGKEAIVSGTECGEPTEILSGVLPVLTRLFQNEAAGLEINQESVREVFIYSLDIYKSFIHVEANKSATLSEPSIPNSKATPTQTTPSYFGNKQESTDEPKIPERSTSDASSLPTAEEAGIDFDNFVDTPIVNRSESKKFDIGAIISKINFKNLNLKNIDLKKINLKKVLIGVAALVVVILIISGISKIAKKDGNNSDTSISESNDSYRWTPGGFEDCRTIEYLDENACVFKSATTGKYGLMDYQGNVILQPNYDGFERCSSGRDYSSRDSYHTLVKIGTENYQITINGTAVTVSSTPHASHSIIADYINSDSSYDERDRYFEGYAAARKNGKWGYVSLEKDKKVIPYEYDAVNDLQPGEVSACDYCRPVTDGLIAVKKDGLMGIINLENDIIVPFEYTNIMPGKDGVFIACKDGVWGVITVGNAVLSFQGVNMVIVNNNGDFVDPVNDEDIKKYLVVSDDGANVRSGAGASFELVGSLDSGEEIEGYGTKEADNGKLWVRIKYDNSYAYVSMSNLKEVS